MSAIGGRRVPRPLKLVTNWPPESAEELETALFDLRRAQQVVFERAAAGQLERRLQPGRYHLLIARPDTLPLPAERLHRLVASVNLVVLTPSAGSPLDVAQWEGCQRPVVILPPLSTADAQNFLIALCQLLVEQGCLLLTAYHNACWQTLPGGQAAALLLPAHGEAIWPTPPTVETEMPAATQTAPDPEPALLPGLMINRAQFGNGAMYVFKNSGDVVMGDQVKSVRAPSGGAAPGNDIVGGDQVKIGRERRAS